MIITHSSRPLDAHTHTHCTLCSTHNSRRAPPEKRCTAESNSPHSPPPPSARRTHCSTLHTPPLTYLEFPHLLRRTVSHLIHFAQLACLVAHVSLEDLTRQEGRVGHGRRRRHFDEVPETLRPLHLQSSVVCGGDVLGLEGRGQLRAVLREGTPLVQLRRIT